MANQLIVNYLSDKSIPVETRRNISEGLNSGKLSEAAAIKGITAKYADKYGKLDENMPKPTSDMGGEIAKNVFGAFNPSKLIPNAVNAVKTGAELADKAGVKVSVTPADSEERNQATEYLNTKGIVPDAAKSNNDIQNTALLEKVVSGDKLREDISGLQTGAVKGAASSVLGLSELTARGMDAVTKPLQDAMRPAVQSITEPVVRQLGEAPTSQETFNNMEQARQDLTAPKNLAETAGKTVEQIAEFMAPGMGGAKAEQALNFGQKLLNIGKTAGKEALIGAAVSAAQNGDLNKDVVDTAILSGAIPIVSNVMTGVKNLVGKGMQKAAENQISQLIKPSKDAFLFGKNPSKAIIDEGIVANNFDDLTKKLSDKMDDIGKQLDDVVRKAPSTKTADVSKIISGNADDFGKKVVDKNSWSTYSDKLQQLTGEFKADIKSGQLVKVSDLNLSKMTANDVWKLQKKVGKLTQWTGAMGEKEANKQLHKLYNKLGKVLDNLAPGTKELQFRYANMLGANKAAVARKAVAERNTELVRILGGATVGGIVNPAGGDDLTHRALNAAGGALLFKVANSPALKTRLAQLLGKPTVTNELVGPIVEAVLKEISSN